MEKITVKKIFENLLEIISGSCFVICTLIVLVNIFLRYFMNTGLYWSEEVCTGFFVWGVYLGSAACYKRGMHLGVDVLVKKLPNMLQKIVAIVVNFILVVINAYITYQSYVYVTLSYNKPTPVLNVSTAYISVSIVFSFACMTVFSIKFLIESFLNFRGKKVDDESQIFLGKGEK